MRLSQTPPSLLSLLLVLLQTNTCQAGPYPKDDLHDLGFSYLKDRACGGGYCGAQNQYCCEAGQACFTNAANVAYCSAGQAIVQAATGAGYAVYTTTYVETDLVTRTSTFSSWYQVATQTTYIPPPAVATGGSGPPICTTSLGQSSCGDICCASNQRCHVANTCTYYSSSFVPAPTGTSTYSVPLRPTSGGVSITTTVSATTTQGFIPPATASGSSLPITPGNSNNGLSGGEIAGIVIGVIAGIILLLLLCFCFIVKAGFDGLLAIFGLGKKKHHSRETIISEERYSRHGSSHAASRRNTHTGWFGASRPARVSEKRKESSGLGGLGMVGAGLIGLAAILGLKRNHDKKKATTSGGRSDISSSYYTDSYTGTSASSASSDRRTHRTRDTRGTRTTRTTRR